MDIFVQQTHFKDWEKTRAAKYTDTRIDEQVLQNLRSWDNFLRLQLLTWLLQHSCILSTL